jgi:AraC-like DNA-binding protein
MKKKISQLNWKAILKDIDNVYSIGEDFILLEKPVILMAFEHPFKVDAVTIIICTAGTFRGKMNLQQYETQSPCMVIVLAGQILEYEYSSDDFEGKVILMSKRFLESLHIEKGFSAFVSIRENPCIPLTESELEAIGNYYAMMLGAIAATDNPHRLEIAKNLTRAFFYGMGYYLHKTMGDKQKSKNETLVDNFMKLVQIHFKTHRGTKFYADKLCLTPKYMSSIIKEASGKSASEWIDELTVLEIKTLLKTTNMTIQQIADELNFPAQSSLGKFFKRLVGTPPKEYRKG